MTSAPVVFQTHAKPSALRKRHPLTLEQCPQSRPPIRTRAQGPDVGLDEIQGRLATTFACLPRPASLPAGVGLTGSAETGLALRLTPEAVAGTCPDTHRSTHAGLLAALKLDLPE